MKNHFLSLFQTTNRKWTLSLLCIGTILIIAGNLVGISDNPPGIVMVFLGMILLFFALIHSWRKPSYYLILAGISAGIIFLIFLGIYIYASLFLKPGSANVPTAAGNFFEAFFMLTIIFICMPGIIAGLLGAIIRGVQKKTQNN